MSNKNVKPEDNMMKEEDWYDLVLKVENWEKACDAVKTEHANIPYRMADALRQFKLGKNNVNIRNKVKRQLMMAEKYAKDNLKSLQDKKYIFSDEKKNALKREMDIEEAYMNGITISSEDYVAWPILFESRGSKLVDAKTEAVIAEVVKARTDMAALIDGISNGLDLLDIYEVSAEVKKELPKLSNEELLTFAQQHALEVVEEVIEAWAKTLVLETKPLKSVTPDNHDLSFGSIHEILSQNSPVSKLREYRRAFGEKFDSKSEKGILIARHKVKWSGRLEDAPIINYTPVKRAKKGENKK